ncbi:phosphonate ABC transporter ATP-binding protein [Jiella sp. MQZ9-1]|uniref:Phosphonate ABC transporter ATP-binding protein n=1 Tax=Jiella flava TaxID=2816857 RepID=A0A939FYD2_9HYPH|nr:phosphonate ABC transporter ATP-binding protein [Jiella flava]MBO0663144.1 phosphonate ABC transporter ATP-binding protein [Jiella flava]MCD2471563.1 phosphonate ABC transporter ATP-binding protein [Jiella flava]
MTAIAVENLSKRFFRIQALSQIGLVVKEGEMVALIGASGSGKSTLMRHIAGLERGDAGSHIRIFGETQQRDGKFGANMRALRGKTGVIFQQFNLAARLPVITNVLVGVLGRIPAWRGTLGLFTRAEKEDAIAALSRVGIAERAWQRASTLSGGQQQRAAIARTLMQRSKILLADEPIASLDPASARRVMDALANINSSDGITVLVSLHQVEYARVYCPRTVALREGRVVYDGPSDALTDAFLTELYGAASEELVLPQRLPVKPQAAEASASTPSDVRQRQKDLIPA